MLSARCVPEKGSTLGARFKFYDDDEFYTGVRVFKFFIHPDWDPEVDRIIDDISIAVVDEHFELPDEFRHVCLNTPSNPIQSFVGQNATVYGWGLRFSPRLRGVEVTLVEQALCNSSSPITDTSFCVKVIWLFCTVKKYSLEILSGPGSEMVLETDGLLKIVGIASSDIYVKTLLL